MASTSVNSTFNYSSTLVPIFDGESYDYWSIQMKTLFISQDLWEIIEGGFSEPESSEVLATWTQAKQKEYKENVRKNAKALLHIQQGVSKSIFPRIMGAKTSKEAWELLKNEFQGSEKIISIKLQSLWRDFDNLAMKDNENVKGFSSRVSEIKNQIRSLGDTIEDKKIVEKILRSLPEKFDHIVAAIEESKDLSKLSLVELMGSLEAHEKRISRFTGTNIEQAFQTKLNILNMSERRNPENQRGNSFQQQQGRGRRNFQSQNRGKGKKFFHDNKNGGNFKSDSTCYICHKTGHDSKECRFRCTKCKVPNHSQRDCWFQQSNQQATNHSDANFSEENSTKQLFYSCMSSQIDAENTWYLDSGCSNHMTGNKKFFVEVNAYVQSQVKLGDGKLQSVEGRGIIVVQTKGGNTKLIHNVLYVPGLTQNLLSVGQLIQNGYSVIFEKDECSISEQGKILQTVKMSQNKVFPLVMPTVVNSSFSKIDKIDESELWHLRYGHLNYKGLKLLNQKNMVVGLPKIEMEDKICEGCIYGKMHRLPFPKIAWRATAPLELVHADICGPTRTSSFQNKRYFLLFVDDFSRMMWVYFLEQKSEAFSKFLEFMKMAERQSGSLLKMLRTDRGGEFISKEFMNHCKSAGIKRQLTVRYSPQQNGVAERKNRTIVEMARSMLKAKNLPNNFWAEAVNTAVYILNRSPTKAVMNMTPFQAWHRRKPQVNFLKIFGCIAYSLVPSQQREKFDEKGEKFIFIGYSDESKAYRLFDPKTNKLVISRDVQFDEMNAWEWDNKKSQEEKSTGSTSTTNQTESNPNANPESQLPENDANTESPIRKVRSLRDIYESTNVAFFSCEPHNFEEAVNDEVWQKAMDEEISTIEKNHTWELVDYPEEKDVVGLKWIYKTKFKEDGSIQKHKARLVAKGYSQQPGIDFNETFAPVARMETIRTVLALATQLELQVFQLDVKSAFLNGELEEEVYVEQPQGYEVQGKENMVYRLRKALYGLKQAPRAWNSNIDKYFLQNGFQRSPSEPSLYVKSKGTNDFIIVCLYVDDLIYTGTNLMMLEEFKKAMMEEYEMTDLGLMKYFLGIQVRQSKGEIFISQEKYTEDLLKKFNMSKSKPVTTPMVTNEKLQQNDGAKKVDASLYRSLVGSLMYLTNTRPDIVHPVSVISRFMSKPSQIHYSAAKRILRYLQGTKNIGIKYVKEKDNSLMGYTDSDWAGSIDDRKSTSGYLFCMGTKPISWSSRKQKTVALSSAEAEYIAATDAACEAIWLRRIFADLKQEQMQPTTLFCDNMSAIAMTKNPVFHARTKHIEIRHHFIRSLVNNEEIKLNFVNTEMQHADSFTKSVPSEKLEQLKTFTSITN